MYNATYVLAIAEAKQFLPGPHLLVNSDQFDTWGQPQVKISTKK